MSTHEQRIEVFQDTCAWIKSDKVLSDSVIKAKAATEIFYEDEYPSFNIHNEYDRMAISVTGDRSYQAAMRLSKEMPGARIAVMNFANAFHAGGGVTKGSSAQEECLCRTSTLYPLLYRRTLRDSFYKHHYDLGTAKASDSLIYTEGVIICKTDEDLPKRMPKEDWVTVDVITIAAPDLRTKSNPHAELVGNGTYMNNAELFGYHVKRAIHMLTVAAAKKADILVLGAFGCGAFENDPEVVARAYKTALQEFPKMFKKVEFAVYCPPSGSRNYEVFKRILGNVVINRKEMNEADYSTLTCFLDEFQNDEFGKWHHEEGHKGTKDDPIPMPFIMYSDTVNRFIKAIYDFIDKNPDYNLRDYMKIMEDHGIGNLDEFETEGLDGRTVMAVFTCIIRQERFCDGLILSCLQNGTVQKLLERLKVIENKRQ